MSRYNKLIAAATGAAGEAVTLGLLPGSASKWVAVAVAFLTTAGVWAVPNQAAPPPPPTP